MTPKPISKEWRDAPVYTRAVLVTYAGFLVGYFLAPQAPEHYEYYYYLVFVPSLALWPVAFRRHKENLLSVLIAAYIAYMLLSVFWSPDFSWSGAARVFWHGGLVASFLIVSMVLREEFPDTFEHMLRLLIFVAVAHGIVSIIVWYWGHPFPGSRMHAAGRLQWEIRAAGVYGLFWILALMYFLESGGLWRWLYGGSAFVLMLTVLFLQTRTTLLSMLVCGTMLAARKNVRILGLLALAALITVFLLPDMWHNIIRGLPYRPSIWVTALNDALEHWFIGTGYLADTRVDTPLGPWPHAHNMFLATFRDGGIIGLVLLIAILAIAFKRALYLSRVCGNNIYLVLLVNLLITSLLNPDRLLTRPREQWLFIWLPLILVAVDYVRLMPAIRKARRTRPQNKPVDTAITTR